MPDRKAHQIPTKEQPKGLSEKDIEAILAWDGKTIARVAEWVAGELGELKTAQMRNFYGPMTKIRESNESEENKLNRLHLMRPRLAYMAARQRDAVPLRNAFEQLIQKAEPKKPSLDGIFDFAEAVVGYHKKNEARS